MESPPLTFAQCADVSVYPLQIFRRPDHRPPHMRDRAVVEAEPLVRLAEIAADHIGEFFELDHRVRIERIDVVDRNHPATCTICGYASACSLPRHRSRGGNRHQTI